MSALSPHAQVQLHQRGSGTKPCTSLSLNPNRLNPDVTPEICYPLRRYAYSLESQQS